MRSPLLTTLIALTLLATAPPAASGPAGPRDFGGVGNRVPGEYLVTLVPGSDDAALRQALASFGLREVHPVRDRLVLVRLGNDPGPEAVERAVRASGAAESVQPNYVYRLQR